MTIIQINSAVTVLPVEIPDFGTATVKNEPMLFNCDLDAAARLGGTITQVVIEALPSEWKNVPLVVDSRVHMLMPGWYPCIPGYHHDDVPRTRADGQPNYGPGQDRSQHILCLINGGIALTRFALGKASFVVPETGTVYEQWNDEVERKLEAGELTAFDAPTNRLVQFDDRTWHTGVKANAHGWRFFIRFSRYFDSNGNPIARRNPRTNEIRRQVQVYLDKPKAGW